MMKKYILYDDQYILLFQYFIEKIYNKKDKNNDIYIKNFSLFFECFKEKLKTVNRNLETFLHITANYNNKQIFVDLFLKLSNMKLISSELILIQNIFGDTCLDIIFNHYFSNKKKNINNKIYINLFKEIKKNKNILDSLPDIYKNEINLNQISSVYFINYEKINSKNSELYAKNIIEMFNKITINKELIFNYLILQNIGFSAFNFIYLYNQEKYEILNNMLLIIKRCQQFYTLKDRYLFEHLFFILKETKKLNDSTNQYINKFIKDIIYPYLNEGKKYWLLINRRKIEHKWNIYHYLFINQYLNFTDKKELFEIINKILLNNNNTFINKLLRKYDTFGYYPFIYFFMNNEVTNDDEKVFLHKLFSFTNIKSKIILNRYNKEINIIEYLKLLSSKENNTNFEIFFKLIIKKKLFDINTFINLIGGYIGQSDSRINKKVFVIILNNIIKSNEEIIDKRKFFNFCKNNLSCFDRELLLNFSNSNLMDGFEDSERKIFISKLIRIAVMKNFPEEQLKEIFVSLTNSINLNEYSILILEILLRLPKQNEYLIKIMKEYFLSKINNDESIEFKLKIFPNIYDHKKKLKTNYFENYYIKVDNIYFIIEMFIYMFYTFNINNKTFQGKLIICDNNKIKYHFKFIFETFKYPINIIKQIFTKIISQIFPHDYTIFSKNFTKYENISKQNKEIEIKEEQNKNFYKIFCDYLLIKYGKRNPNLEKFFQIFYKEFYEIFPNSEKYFLLYHYIHFICFNSPKYLEFIDKKECLIKHNCYRFLPYVFIDNDEFIISQKKLLLFIYKNMFENLKDKSDFLRRVIYFINDYLQFFNDTILEDAINYILINSTDLSTLIIEIIFNSKIIFKQETYNKILKLYLNKYPENILFKYIFTNNKNFLKIGENKRFQKSIIDNFSIIFQNLIKDIDFKKKKNENYDDDYSEHKSEAEILLDDLSNAQRYIDYNDITGKYKFKTELYCKILSSLPYNYRREILNRNIQNYDDFKKYSCNIKNKIAMNLCMLDKQLIVTFYNKILKKMIPDHFSIIYNNIINYNLYSNEKIEFYYVRKVYLMIYDFIFSKTIYFKGYEVFYFLSIIKNECRENLNVYLFNILVKIINIQKENEKNKEKFYNSIFIHKIDNFKNRKIINNNNMYLNFKSNQFNTNIFENLINNTIDIENNFNTILKYFIYYYFDKNNFNYLDYFISIENCFEQLNIESEEFYDQNIFIFLSYNYNKSREYNIFETLKQIIEKEKYKKIKPSFYKINNNSIKLLNNTDITILERNLSSLTQNFPNLSEIIKQNIILRDMIIDILYYSLEKLNKINYKYINKKEYKSGKNIFSIIANNYEFLITDIDFKNEKLILLFFNILKNYLFSNEEKNIYSLIESIFLGNNFINSISNQSIQLKNFSNILTKLLLIIKSEIFYDKIFQYINKKD